MRAARFGGGMAGDTKDKLGRRGQRFGRYQIVAHIASGGMAAVYKAFDPDEKRIVALKIMSHELMAKPNMIARFKREAISVAKMRDDHIVAIHEFGEACGTFFLAMEFVDGKDLHDYISHSPGGRLGPEEARQITLQTARALDHIYQEGVIHRDIKPSNLLVTQEPGGPHIKLTDLGLARHEDDDEHRVTKAGATLGTVDYMAPEQARDSTKADIRSDIYSLGCTMFQMLAGRPPFPKGTMAEKLVQHIENEPPDICRVNEAVPKELGLILRKMLAKKPRDRYQTPAELLEDLEDPSRVLQARPAPEKKPRKASEPMWDEEKDRARADDAVGKKKMRRSRAGSGTKWLPWAVGGGIVAILGLILLIVVNGRRPPPEEKKPEQVKVPEKKIEPVVKLDPVKQVVGPPAPALPALYHPVLPLDREALAKEMLGLFAEPPPAPPAGAKVIVVSRFARPATPSVRTLAEAVAQIPAQGAGVIEIRDQGPHFLASLPALAERSLWIRGGGVRPLLAWDGGGASNLLTLSKGHLTLEDLDFAVHVSANAPPKTLSLFHVQGGNFHARGCTFSIGGKHSPGVIVARLQGSGPATTASLANLQDAAANEAKARFTHCLLRGAHATLLATHNTPADILIDHTLAVGGARPLFAHRNLEEDGLTVRIVRSTLAAQQHLWRWEGSAGQGGAPRLKILAWDALLAHTDGAAADGDLVHLADGARPNLMGWRAVNCLYAGWRNLLGAGGPGCADLGAWRTLWGHREGDSAQSEPWPPRPLGAIEELSAMNLHPAETPAAFAATGGPGPIGCDLGALPPEPPYWKQRTFEKFPLAAIPLPEIEPPEIPTAPEGLYHGETIKLGKFDLGLHVQARLQTMKPGPHVVLRLVGKGTHVTSPLRFKGVERVVICFEQEKPAAGGKEKLELLTLELKPGGNPGAMIDVEGGSLEIQQGRFRYENSRLAGLPPHLIRVRGGDLSLQRCTIIGPLSKTPDSFHSLIALEGAGAGAPQPAQITLRDCVLLCGKPLIELKNPGARLRCRGCLLYALGDVVAIDVSALTTSRPDLIALFENNTIALRRGFVQVRCFEGPSACQPIVLQTQANYFIDPFVDEPRQACLVKLSADSLARGLLLWQGQGNVFARDRLAAYCVTAETPVAKQSFKEWEQLTGPVGETDSIFVDALPAKAFAADQPTYDRLALPPTLRRDPMPGADLAKLGLVKKK
jgi:eukaryotic-like serine/threonine-protein kinase